MKTTEPQSIEINFFTSKRLLCLAGVCVGGIILTLLIQWSSLKILLYPIITSAGAIVFGVLAEKKRETSLAESVLTIYPLGNEQRNFRLLIFSLFGQFLFLIFWGWDAQVNPHLMDNYGMLFYLPIWALFVLGWTGTLWRMPNITMYNHQYYEKQMPWKRKLNLSLFVITGVFLIFAIVESLIIMYSTAYSGVWQLEIILPETQGSPPTSIPNVIYVSGFNYFLGWFLMLEILVFLIMRFQETRKMARILKDQLKTKHQKENSSEIALSEALLDHFVHGKIL